VRRPLPVFIAVYLMLLNSRERSGSNRGGRTRRSNPGRNHFGKPASTFPDHALSTLARRCRMDRERVNTAGEFARERGVDHTMTLQPALSAKCFRHDMETEVRLAARPVSCVPLVPVRLVLDAETVRRESLVQLFCDEIARGHDFVGTGMFRKAGSWCFKRSAPAENPRSGLGDARFCLLSSLEAAIDGHAYSKQ
jgi:hypothetical protein